MKLSLFMHTTLFVLAHLVLPGMVNAMNGNASDDAKAKSTYLTNENNSETSITKSKANIGFSWSSSSSRPVRYLRESKREVEDPSSTESGRTLMMSGSTMEMMGGTLEDHLNGMVEYGAITVDQKISILSFVGNIDNSVVYDKRNNVDRTFNKQMLRGYIKGQEQSGRLSNEAAAYLWNLLELQPQEQQQSQSRSPAKKGYGGGGTYPGSYGDNGVVQFLGHIAAPDPVSVNAVKYAGIWGYYDSSTGKEYALQTSPGALHIIDVTDPTQPDTIQKIEMKGGTYWRDVATHGDYAYVGAQGSRQGYSPPYYIVDMSNGIPVDGSRIKEVSGYDNRGHTVNVENGIFCLNSAGTTNGCTCFDVETNPWEPQEIFQWSGNYRDCHDSFIRKINDYTEVLVSSEGYADRFTIVNITDRNNPTFISSTPILSGIYAHQNWMSEDNKYLFGFDEKNLYDIIVYDVSDLSKNPVLINQFQWSGEDTIGNSYVHNGAIRGNYLFVAYYQAGFRVFDISNPYNIIEVGKYETYRDPNRDGNLINVNWGAFDGAWNVYTGLNSGNILVSDSVRGTFVLNVEDLSPPTLDSSLIVVRTTDNHQLSWVASNDATGYNIYRGSTVDSVNTLIAENVVTNTYDDASDSCTCFYYYVIAKNAGGESVPTNVATDESCTTPCAIDETCVPPICGTCSSCNTNENDCINSGCSYTVPPPIGCGNGCGSCSKKDCSSTTGCISNKGSCITDPNYTDGGTCTGTPVATCVAGCSTNADCDICNGESCGIGGICEVTANPIQCNFCEGTCVAGSCVSPPSCTHGCDVNGDACFECSNEADCGDGNVYFCSPDICNNGYCESGSNPCSGATPVCDEDIDECVAGPSCLDAGAGCSNASDCCSNKCRGGTCKK